MNAPRWWEAQHRALYGAAGLPERGILPAPSLPGAVLQRCSDGLPADFASWRWAGHPEAEEYRPLPTRGQEHVTRFLQLPLVFQAGVTRNGQGTGALLVRPLAKVCVLAGLYGAGGDVSPFLTWVLSASRADLDRVLLVHALVTRSTPVDWLEAAKAARLVLDALGAPKLQGRESLAREVHSTVAP